jgi:hypothetical protein
MDRHVRVRFLACAPFWFRMGVLASNRSWASEPPLCLSVEPEAVKSTGAEPYIGKIVGPLTKAAAETRKV